jgi:hypothetical protein
MTTDKLAITEHFVRAEARYIVEKAKEVLVDKGGFPPSIFIACRVSPIDGTPLTTEDSIVPVIHRSDDYTPRSKEETIYKARAVALAGDALASIVCMNSWGVIGLDAKTKEDADKIMADIEAGRMRIDEHPNRVELIMVNIEWRGKSEVVAALKCVRDQGFIDFDEVPELSQSVEVNGAFCIMPPPDWTPPASLVESAREYSAGFVTKRSTLHERQASRGGIARG